MLSTILHAGGRVLTAGGRVLTAGGFSNAGDVTVIAIALITLTSITAAGFYSFVKNK